MQAIASIGLSNAAVAVLLAVLVFVVTRFWRNPALAHALWLLVLLKFIAPPLVGVALKLPVTDLLATPPVDVTTVPPVESLAETPIEIPSEPREDFPGGRADWVLDDGFASDGAELPEPSPALEPFDPWTPSASPNPPEQTLPAELASEALATAPLVTDDEALDEAHDETELLLDAPLAGTPEQNAPEQSIAPSPQTRFDTAIPTPLENPSFGYAFSFDAVWPYAAGVWLAGAVIWFVAVGVRLWRFGKLLKRTDAAPDPLRDEVAGLAEQIGLRSAPDVRLVDAAIPPLAWAMFGRPLLLLPRALIGRLDADERLTLLAHELAHLRRRDHLTRWLEIVVLGLYWWQPVAWFARRQLHCAAEQCCDAWVVRRFPEHARAYAQALFKTVEFLADADTALPLGATGFSQANLLERRFAMILQGRRTDRLSRTVRYGLLLLGLVILPLSIRSLWADEPTPAEPVPAAEPATDAAKPPAAAGLPAADLPATGSPTLAPQTADAATAAPRVQPAVPPVPATAPAPNAPPAPTDAPQSPAATNPFAAPPALSAPVREVPSATVPPASYAPLDSPTIPGTRGRDDSSGNIDERLSRLESTVETLVRELRGRPIEPRPPTPYSTLPVPQGAYGQPPATYYAPSNPGAYVPSNPGTAPVTPYGPQSMPNAAPAYNQATPHNRATPKTSSSRSSPRVQSVPKYEEQPNEPSSGPPIEPRYTPIQRPQSSAPLTDGPDPRQVVSVPPSNSPASPTPEPGPPSQRQSNASERNAELNVARNRAVSQDRELEAARVYADLEKSFRVCQEKHAGYKAAAKYLEDMRATYSNDTTMLDQLLDAQQRSATAEIEFSQSLYDMSDSQNSAVGRARAVALAKVRSLTAARDSALKTWRDIQASSKQRGTGGEPEKEAQAREQYFKFRKQIEAALNEYLNAESAGKRY